MLHGIVSKKRQKVSDTFYAISGYVIRKSKGGTKLEGSLASAPFSYTKLGFPLYPKIYWSISCTQQMCLNKPLGLNINLNAPILILGPWFETPQPMETQSMSCPMNIIYASKRPFHIHPDCFIPPFQESMPIAHPLS